jgi:intracellular multiplication protein IcmE
MSNNDLDDDLDVETFDDSGFDDYSKKGSLGDLWRNNPMVKIGAILALFALFVGGIILFGGGGEKPPASMVSSGMDVTEAPGTSEISSTMEQAIQDKNAENVEEAARTGGSAIPIPTQPSKGVMPLPVDETAQEDPLERWRQMQEERVRQQQVMNQALPPDQQANPPVDTKAPAVSALSQSMISQMQSILQEQKAPKFVKKDITPVAFLEDLEKKKQDQLKMQQQMIATAGTASDTVVQDIIIPAGTIEYAQLILEANTDAPGPVLAQIMSGPLNGAKILGSFTSTDNYLTLNFSTIVIDGIDYSVQAVAIDPGTTLPGVITEIDRRYFKRIVLPMAAEFITGLTEAISESGTTSIYVSDSNVTESTADKNSEQEVASGITKAGEKFGDILDKEAHKTKPMLRVASGTPIGVLFVAPVIDKTNPQ